MPTPAMPPMALIPTTPPSATMSASVPSSRASSAWRPVKLAVSRGKARVAAAANAPRSCACLAASTSAVGPRPRAAATNNARTGSARSSASASSLAVSGRAVRWTPRSRSLTDRGLSPAASASSSCVSPASARNCCNKPANPCTGCSATAPPKIRPPWPGHGQEPRPQAYAGPSEPSHAPAQPRMPPKPTPRAGNPRAQRPSSRVVPHAAQDPRHGPAVIIANIGGDVGVVWVSACGHAQHCPQK